MPQTVSSEYLTQLVSVIRQQQQTGLLRIEQIGQSVNKQGEIYFEDGHMFYARVGDERGRPALERISEWEHVIYAFQAVARPLRNNTPRVLGARRPFRTQQLAPLAESQTTSPPPLTDQVPPKLRANMTEPLSTSSEVPPPESTPLARVKTVLRPAHTTQPLILRGETLETYVPAAPTRMSPASQRWTTHQHPQVSPSTLPGPPPATPRPHQPPGEEALPGPLAIFRAKVTITSTETMRQMERRERIAFVLLDGKRTLQHIAYLLHQSEGEIGQVLLTLAKKGLAEYVEG